MGHKFERGTLKLEVKWQGYDDPSDRTWETESNLQTAPEAVAEYFDELGGRPEPPSKKKAAGAGAKPGKKRRISGVESPASAPGSSKRGRPPRRKSAAADDDDEEDGSEEASGAGGTDDYKSLKKLGYPQEHDWDPHIQQVVTIEQQPDPKGEKNLKYAKIIWKDSRRENKAIPLSIAHKRFPQKVRALSCCPCLC
jgi:chromobox protein 1